MQFLSVCSLSWNQAKSTPNKILLFSQLHTSVLSYLINEISSKCSGSGSLFLRLE